MSIWLIGNKGMLGLDVESLLQKNRFYHISSDQEVDIADQTALQEFTAQHHDPKIEWIINCSGYTAVDKAEAEPDSAFRINAHGVGNIADIAKDLDATLIHISTDYVFAGDKDSPYSENDSTAPAGVYARSKLQGEQNILQRLDKYFIIRTAWLYGTRGNNFLRIMLLLFQQRDTVQVVSDQWGSPTYTKDLARVILHIIRSHETEYGIYHYTNAGKTNWFEFAQEIYRQARRTGLVNRDVRILPIATEDYPTLAKRPHYSYLSKEKIQKTLRISIRNWQIALQDCIEEIVE